MGYKRITPAQKAEIMILKALGFEQKEIAVKLGYSEQSISYQVSIIRETAEKQADDLIYFMFSQFTGLSVTELIKRLSGETSKTPNQSHAFDIFHN